MDKFMKKAVDEAWKGLRKNEGGPFGAVIVRKGKIIATGHNEVVKTNDPTAHAEITAIRAATKKLKRFYLSDCEIYTSCEPCPMCFSAIYWARIPKMYYGCTRKDAEAIGFSDKYIYDVIKGKAKPILKSIQLNKKECRLPMIEWNHKVDKVAY